MENLAPEMFLFFVKIAEYKGEYYRQHAVIKNFWQVFHSSALDWKEKFLGKRIILLITTNP